MVESDLLISRYLKSTIFHYKYKRNKKRRKFFSYITRQRL